MEPSSLIEKMVDDRLKVSLEEHRASMLTDMERIVQKISEHSSSNQLSKFSSILTGVPTFKRKSNEEQYKYNTKVSIALEETEQLLDMDKIEDSSRKIAEVKALIAHRQKIIRLADSSELGWRLVNEYETNPLASDSDDEKRMYKAEARANRKLKAEKAKKTRGARSWPYRKPAAAPGNPAHAQAAPVAAQQHPRRPGLCFACGKPGHWRGAAECTANSSNNKVLV